MELVAYTEPEFFLQAVQEDLEQREAENSLVLGSLLHMCGPGRGEGDARLLAVLQNQGSWSVAAMMTPPHPLVLAGSQPASRAELAHLAGQIFQSGLPVSGVVAAPPLAGAFAHEWSVISGWQRQSVVRQRIYRLAAVANVNSRPGQLRRAATIDLELVARWFAEFDREALNENDPGGARQRAERRIERGEVYLWEDTEPRCIAARARPTRNSISVNAVYTPLQWRRQGYATATVAQLSRELLAEGYSMCILYTDLSNPTSNRIYQDIGYEPVCDSEHVLFATARQDA